MAKRAADSIVAIQDLKRSRNELVAITSRDKALLETVRYTKHSVIFNFYENVFSLKLLGCKENIESFFTDYASGGT